MKAKIEKAKSDFAWRWRSFFLFDSDRLHPDELLPTWRTPSADGCQGLDFELACSAADVPASHWKMLRRRSIENYLPKEMLERRDASSASLLTSLTVGTMSHHYNMKQGLEGDGIWPQNPPKPKPARAARSRGFWASLTSAEKDVLQKGFGKDVSEEFANVALTHRWEDEVVTEADEIIAALYDAL